MRPASLHCSQRMLALQLRDHGRIWSSDYPEVDVTNRGYVSFVTGAKAREEEVLQLISLYDDSVTQAKLLLSPSYVQVDVLSNFIDNCSIDTKSRCVCVSEICVTHHILPQIGQIIIYPFCCYFTHLSLRSDLCCYFLVTCLEFFSISALINGIVFLL